VSDLITQASVYSGHDSFRLSTDQDVVDGVCPRFVAEPPTPETLAATLGWASSNGLSVLVRGGGTKLDWGTVVQPVDLLLSTASLNAVIEHRHGDLTATIQAGARLSTVNSILAKHRQWLPLDPPWLDRSTIGGLISTNDSGPRRHYYGSPRDLIIGVSFARSDGQLAKAGGIVVKNVAGYDISRLLTGSFGCLGVIVSATFKLAPVASSSRTVLVDLDSSKTMASAITALSNSSLTPTAMDLEWFPAKLLIRFESIEAAVEQQASEAVSLVSNYSKAVVLKGNDESKLWARVYNRWNETSTVVKLSVLPTALVKTLTWLQDACATQGLRLAVTGRAGLGVVDVWLCGAIDAQVLVINDLRKCLPSREGAAVIRRGVPSLRQQVDPWGTIGDSLPLMRLVKAQFDPKGRLNSGRGPGGI